MATAKIVRRREHQLFHDRCMMGMCENGESDEWDTWGGSGEDQTPRQQIEPEAQRLPQPTWGRTRD
jgi:hypothetical protein